MPITIDSFKGRYRWLSNFYPCDVVLYDGAYLSVEHAYQASKFKDGQMRQTIRAAKTAAEAKQLGKCPGMVADWDAAKLGIMGQLLRQKFVPKSDLAVKLLATDDAVLVEGNYWGDYWWGVCDGKGENHLGRLLMEIREELRC